jgi:uncharacterized protein YjbJ (UPF0337 family)
VSDAVDSRTLSVVTDAETRARINGIRDAGSASDRGEGGVVRNPSGQTAGDKRRESSGKMEKRKGTSRETGWREKGKVRKGYERDKREAVRCGARDV